MSNTDKLISLASVLEKKYGSPDIDEGGMTIDIEPSEEKKVIKQLTREINTLSNEVSFMFQNTESMIPGLNFSRTKSKLEKVKDILNGIKSGLGRVF